MIGTIYQQLENMLCTLFHFPDVITDTAHSHINHVHSVVDVGGEPLDGCHVVIDAVDELRIFFYIVTDIAHVHLDCRYTLIDMVYDVQGSRHSHQVLFFCEYV